MVAGVTLPTGRERQEWAVADEGDGLGFQRFGTREGAEDHMAWVYGNKEKARQEWLAWDADEEAQKHGNAPYYHWHVRRASRMGPWKDAEFRIVVRTVTPWREPDRMRESGDR